MILVGAVGHTRTRWALARRVAGHGQLGPVHIEASIVETDIALANFLDQAGRPPLDSVVICAAGRMIGDDVLEVSGGELRVEAERIAAVAGCAVRLLGISEAVAHSLRALGDEHLHLLREGQALPGSPQLVIGVGAELDLSIVVPDASGDRVWPGDGGPLDLVPVDDEELAIWQALRATLGRVSADKIFTPAGLLALHRARSCAARSTEHLLRDALAGEAQPQQTLRIYARWFGRWVGSLALATGARGGVYISGSVVPDGLAWFDTAAFALGFDDYGESRDTLARIPLYAITHPQPALLGCVVVASSGATPHAQAAERVSSQAADFIA